MHYLCEYFIKLYNKIFSKSSKFINKYGLKAHLAHVFALIRRNALKTRKTPHMRPSAPQIRFSGFFRGDVFYHLAGDYKTCDGGHERIAGGHVFSV